MSGSESIPGGNGDISKKTKLLRTGYVAILTLLFLSIVSMPYLIKGNLSLRGSLVVKEEIFEGVLIALLILVGYLVSRIYKKELDKHVKKIEDLASSKKSLESRLNDAFNYIGEVNVQLLEIQSVFSALKKYPESKKDFRNILRFFAQKALGIVNAGWVMFRIVELDSLRTLLEYSEARATAILPKHHISNRALVGNEAIDAYTVVSSDHENLAVKLFCLLSTGKLTANQEILIKAIVNELEMLFVIFSSGYYKESSLKKNRLQKPAR